MLNENAVIMFGAKGLITQIDMNDTCKHQIPTIFAPVWDVWPFHLLSALLAKGDLDSL